MGLMILLKILQGGASAILPPGFNSVTLGIVGSTGFTIQVAKNRTMTHIGTSLIVAAGSLIAYLLYPNIGALFIVSPLTTIGVYYNLVRIKPNHIDRDAARALIIESPTMTEYEHLETQQSMGSHIPDISDMSYERNEYIAAGTSSSSDSSNENNDTMMMYVPPTASAPNLPIHENHNDPGYPDAAAAAATISKEMTQIDKEYDFPTQPASNGSMPSFRFGWGRNRNKNEVNQPRTPLAVLLDPTLVLFTVIVFCFHMANSSVLPLVMQSLALEDEKSGILLSGMCIFIGQGFMSWFAKLCGDYSPKWGRKGLILVALSSLTIRCLSLTILMVAKEQVTTPMQSKAVTSMIVATQLLDSVGAGIFGTMHILVTNDISSRSGRFSLMMGITSSAMCLGATVSSYIGQSIAHDFGYSMAFISLGALSLVPLLLYAFFMPETLPDYVRPKNRKRRLVAILKRLNESRRQFFRRKKNKQVAVQIEESGEKHEGLVPHRHDGNDYGNDYGNDDYEFNAKPNMELV
eukprot:CAMPEP_0172380292 /NCGR_PEP_ID=MMETSP1060-20121228/70362_1 /TAXON_ID=37318 /ORGANISM="Pseudo-nitzschia pungens, Strain cf. cingulata" /LENGTH=519 /DNA_ID=CAMNT_0013108045 /DNA_START=1052 /DNA_END=2611 /DNA_ORIENTATION=+